MKIRIDSSKKLNWLLVEPHDDNKTGPVLLFLHGMKQASKYLDELPLVFVHHAPPFQAIMGRLKNVTVVAPQAPHDPEKESNWEWTAYLEEIHDYLLTHFPNRKILATGFSRGGWGILQLRRKFPQTFSKWAVVDPQQGSDDLFEGIDVSGGWLAYGIGHKSIEAFSEKLAKHLDDKNVRVTDYKHGELAMKAYGGDKLDKTESIYDFLELEYTSDAA